MRQTLTRDRRCAYVVLLDGTTAADDLRDLARYLSTLQVAGCDVFVVDASPREVFEENRRVLRWVARHVPARPQHRALQGAIDPIRAAIDCAALDKVIAAGPEVRYSAADVAQVCELLDQHEVVEPQDYLEPMPWWCGIDAGRMLVHRGIEPGADGAASFAFRRAAVRGLRHIEEPELLENPVRRLVSRGAEVFAAHDVFVRRQPPTFAEWLDERPRQAGEDFSLPVKTAFFFALLPMLVVLALLGGVRIAAGYAGALGFAAVALALRGRAGAGAFFPLRACLFAPLWMLERSVSVYWALARRVRVESRPLTSEVIASPSSALRAPSPR